MNRLFRRLKERIQNNKGITTIEIAISAMIIIVALAGFVDMVNVSQKMDTASSVNGYVGRVVASQGGVRVRPTVHHSGNYVTSPQLYREVKTTLENGGFKEEDFKLKINGVEISPTSNVPITSFGDRIKIELTVDYRWELISGALGTDLGSSKTSKREVVSSFKKRNGNIKTKF